MGKGTVAVIGLGAYGLTTLKNLKEEGFDVTGFDRNDYVGGLWNASANANQTSVIKSTWANISKQHNSYSDFPFQDEVLNYPTAAQVYDYLNQYADHFHLRKHFRLRTAVNNIRRSDDGQRWEISTKEEGSEPRKEYFDKVVVTSGTYTEAIMPKIDGLERFKGTVMHSQNIKGANEFKRKNVLIVGFSNSGCDTAVELAGAAKNIYMSHRSGARILRRNKDAPPADHQATFRLARTATFLETISPSLMNWLMSYVIEKEMRKSNGDLDPSWKLLPAPPPSHSTPILNDHIIDLLRAGTVKSVTGIAEIKDASSILLTDGTTLTDIDALIFCTGYRPTFSILSGDANPTAHATPEYDAAKYGSSVRPYSRLYKGIFHPQYPTSLAFNGAYTIISAFTGADVVAQGIAQVFQGAYPLPERREMDRWCDEHYRWAVKQANVGRASHLTIRDADIKPWLNEVCDNKLDEKLGWGVEGWRFWWRERELWRLLMDGVATGFAYRLFEGGRRKRWEAAREAIYAANGKVMGETGKGK